VTKDAQTTLGIQLASQNEKTAACVEAWTSAQADEVVFRVAKRLTGLDWLS